MLEKWIGDDILYTNAYMKANARSKIPHVKHIQHIHSITTVRFVFIQNYHKLEEFFGNEWHKFYACVL